MIIKPNIVQVQNRAYYSGKHKFKKFQQSKLNSIKSTQITKV